VVAPRVNSSTAVGVSVKFFLSETNYQSDIWPAR
jgi:hypothetical protein